MKTPAKPTGPGLNKNSQPNIRSCQLKIWFAPEAAARFPVKMLPEKTPANQHAAARPLDPFSQNPTSQPVPTIPALFQVAARLELPVPPRAAGPMLAAATASTFLGTEAEKKFAGEKPARRPLEDWLDQRLN